MRTVTRALLLPLLAVGLSGCATLAQLGLRAPTFAVDSARQAELRLLAPSLSNPRGGAAVRLYARVGNPNPVGMTLTRLVGNLALEGRQAAEVSFPLGVPLQANGEAVVPIEIALDFADLPGLADVVTRALTGRPLAYRLNGTVGVDAGVLGQPEFGPMTLLAGDLRVLR